MDSSSLLARLHANAPVIAPSLLAADFANLEGEIHRLEEAGAQVLHLDVMDGHFVPNLSFGIPVIQAIRRVTKLPLDVHLMIGNPGDYLKRYREAGADLMTIHAEAVEDAVPLLDEIHRLGAGAGISINPPAPVASIERYLDCCDLILVMSVMAGFGGQKFQSVALEKLRWLRDHVRPEVLLSVDGGVNPETIGPSAEAGASVFVVGTALLGHADYKQRMAELVTMAKRETAKAIAPADS